MTSKTVDKELAFLLMEFDTLPIMTKLKSGVFAYHSHAWGVKGLNCIYIYNSLLPYIQ